jgi:predicted Fe-Mo cluster-binding NifX family protein
MRVAVTASGATPESQVDQRFGRARYLIVVDIETGNSECHDNEVNLNATQGAGIQTAQNVAGLNVDAVLTGHVGPNAFRVLSAAGIKAFTGVQGTVEQAVEAFKAGTLAPVGLADVEGHWV